MFCFILGVAASLIAAILGFIMKVIISEYAIPRIQGRLWEVTDISGRWLPYRGDAGEEAPIGEAVIKQTGTRITMSLCRQSDRDGTATHKEFKYEGRFRSRQLTLLWESRDRPDYRIGAMVLLLSEDGKLFKGLTVFNDDSFPGVGALPYWLRRCHESE